MIYRKITICLILVNLFFAGCYSCSPEAIAKREAADSIASSRALAKLEKSRSKALANLEKRVLKLKHGSTIRGTEKAFGSESMYLFIIQKNEHNYLCVSFSVGDNFDRDCVGYSYYSVFEDKKLYSIMEELPCNWGTKEDERGYWISDVTPIDPNIIFSTKGLFGQDLVNSIRENFPKEKCESNIPLPIPVLIIWYPLHSIISGVLPNDCNCN